MQFTKDQLIELSHPILVGKENFPYEPHPLGFVSPDHWYIECICTIGSHVSTHIEVPYHRDEHGVDCKDWPVEKLVGEAVVLDCLGKKPRQPITLEDVKKQAHRIHEGDMIFLHTGYDKFFREENWQPYPQIDQDALAFLLSFKPKIIGTDASGSEIPGEKTQELDGEPNHVACFANGTAIVESLTNLEAIADCRPTVFVLALKMEKMDASPVRIIAIKDL